MVNPVYRMPRCRDSHPDLDGQFADLLCFAPIMAGHALAAMGLEYRFCPTQIHPTKG